MFEVTVIYLAGIATALSFKSLPFMTAQSRVEDLRKKLERVQEKHEALVTKTLPRLPESYTDRDEFKGMEKRTFLIEHWSLRLTQLEAEITQGGILRFSPLYLDGVIKDLSLELNEINLNTMTTTNAALAVLEKMTSDPNMKRLLYKDEEPDCQSEGKDENGVLNKSLGQSFTTLQNTEIEIPRNRQESGEKP